jgi:hypothetical protein
LWRDDIAVVLRLQGRILRDTLTYMKYSLVPLLVLIVPVILIMIHMNHYYGAAPLAPGRAAVVKVRLATPESLEGELALTAPEGVAVETPPVRIGSLAEADWRVRGVEPGRYQLAITAGGRTVEKELVVSEGWGPISTRRLGTNPWDLLLWPGEPPLPAGSAIESIQVLYEPLPMRLFGWEIHWIILFFVFSIAFGYAFKGPLGVQV